MADSFRMNLRIILLSTLTLLSVMVACVRAGAVAYEATEWTNAHATWYGGVNGAGTMGGACGYGNMNARGFGMNTAALSTPLFNDGVTCGACFEIKCRLNESRWCYANATSVTVTGTNFCPPNPNRPRDGWCNFPRTHFDLTYTMFTQLSQYVAGIIPIQYRRVPCVKQGGIRFTLKGNPWFNLVLVYNVAGSGNVVDLRVKGSRTPGWWQMKQNWGQMWECSRKLVGESLSFQVTVGFQQTYVFNEVAPSTWNFGETYEALTNVDPTLTKPWNNGDRNRDNRDRTFKN